VLREPHLLLLTVALFFCVSIGAATARWLVLLHAYGVSVHPLRAAALQLMGLFFNAVIPGNTGGDFVKNLYVVRGRPVDVLALAVTERLLGMVALIWAGFLITLANAGYVLGEPALAPWLGVLTVLALGAVLGPIAVVLLLPRLLPGQLPGVLGGILAQLKAAIQVLREKPRSGLVVFAISLFIHASNLTYFYQITSTLLGHAPPVSAVSVIFPVGLLTMVLPVSVAGVGVGHMAFDQLFSAVGLSGGANAFHAFIVGNVGPMLLGIVPYLVLRRSRPRPSQPSE
jgi:glycosyltransferase 2 family protein